MKVCYNLERAQHAIQFLVDSPYSSRHIARIRVAVDKPRSLPFRDELETLNELVTVGRQSGEALNKLIEVVQFKRDSAGSYQKQFMAAKRARERKVIQLESMLMDKNLSLDERNFVLQKQYRVWNKEKEEFLKAREPYTWQERNVFLKDFWALKESELDKLIATAKEQAGRVVHRKTIIHPARLRPQTVLGERLVNALSTYRPRAKVHIDSHR